MKQVGEDVSETTLNMDGKRITNVAYPRDPDENTAFDGDVVTAKALNDFREYLLHEILRRNTDGIMNGRLDMAQHRISGLASPVNPDDAVNQAYITSRLQTITNLLNEFNKRINNLEKNI